MITITNKDGNALTLVLNMKAIPNNIETSLALFIREGKKSRADPELGKSDPLLERCLRRQTTSSHIPDSVLLQYHYSAVVSRSFCLIGTSAFLPLKHEQQKLVRRSDQKFCKA